MYVIYLVTNELYIRFEMGEQEVFSMKIMQVETLEDAFIQIKIQNRLLDIQWNEYNRKYWIERKIDNQNRLFQMRNEDLS